MAALEQSRPAQVDLLEIWSYIAADNFDAADKVLDSIRQRCELLADYPATGQIRDEIGRGVRSVTVGEYILLYRAIQGGIELLRVVHGMRDFGDLSLDR